MIQPGQVRKVSVAVMVDGIVDQGRRRQGRLGAAAAGGDGHAAPAGAVGGRVRRFARRHGHDQVRCSLPRRPDQGTVAEGAGSGFLDVNGGRLAQLGVLGAIVLALIFFVLRPMTSRRPLPAARRADRAARVRGRAAATAGTARQRLPRPAGADRQQDRAVTRRDHQPRRGQRGGPAQLDRIPGHPQGACRIMSVLSSGDLLAGLRPRRAGISLASAGSRSAREAAYEEGFLAGQAMATEALCSTTRAG